MRRVLAIAGLLLLTVMQAQGADEGERFVFVDVVGAPGDGDRALANALSNRLLDLGFTVTGTPEANGYEIQGTVKLAPAERGKESVSIDWTVFGPEGGRLGIVTQTKTVRKGSLDRTWGPAADAAANAAAQDILKLLEQ